MREIEFRGKRVDTFEWVYGSAVTRTDGCVLVIVTTAFHEDDGSVSFEYEFVASETVSQYTGLKDKHGKRIYEGDILKNSDDYLFLIEWNKDDAMYDRIDYDGGTPIATSFCWYDAKCGEVIGNIYDNPELLEVQY